MLIRGLTLLNMYVGTIFFVPTQVPRLCIDLRPDPAQPVRWRHLLPVLTHAHDERHGLGLPHQRAAGVGRAVAHGLQVGTGCALVNLYTAFFA